MISSSLIADYDVIFPIGRIDSTTQLAIQSALQQTLPYSSFIAVVDVLTDQDASSIYHILSNIPRLRLLRTNRVGPGIARQSAIDISDSPFVAFLDSDDVWHPQKMEIQMNSLHSKKALFSFSSYFILNSDLSALYSSVFLRHAFSRYVLFFCNPICNSSVVCSRSLLISVGGYSSIRARNDIATWIRLFFIKSVSVATLRKPLTLIAKNKNSVSAQAKGIKFMVHAFGETFNPLFSVIFSIIFGAVNVLYIAPMRRILFSLSPHPHNLKEVLKTFNVLS